MVDNDFLTIFLDEASETLAQWERICMTMENRASEDSVNALFRAAHNLKGSSSSVGLDRLSEFVHAIEDTITVLKNDLVLVTPPVLSIFLECQTILSNWIEVIRSDPEYVPETEMIRQRLAAVLPHAKDLNSGQDSEATGFILFDEAPAPKPAQEAKNLGDILIENGHATQEQIDDAVKVQNAKLGSILVAQGVATKESVKEALEVQKAQGGRVDETIRVGLRKLDALIRLVGELSIQHSIVTSAKDQGRLESAKVNEAISLTAKVIQDLQTEAMSLRMQPVDGLFRRLERVARDVARAQSKNIKVILRGEDVEMDKIVLEKMKDPLVHIIRNAVDHGIESDAERVANGKPESATVTIDAVQTASNVRITISDDGRGLDREKIVDKALKNGLISVGQKLSPEEIHNLIFLPGFSTAEQVTDVSGRGVGMDVVRSAVTAFKGSIDIQSEQGHGTSFLIGLPSTLSVLDALIICVAETSYAVPIQDVQEVVDLSTVQIEMSGKSSRMMSLRGKVIPLESLDSYLPHGIADGLERRPTIAVVTSIGKSQLALSVDSIIGQQSIVVRPVDDGLDEIPGFSGATILASGDPAMIIQLPHILKSHQKRAG